MWITLEQAKERLAAGDIGPNARRLYEHIVESGIIKMHASIPSQTDDMESIAKGIMALHDAPPAPEPWWGRGSPPRGYSCGFICDCVPESRGVLELLELWARPTQAEDK